MPKLIHAWVSLLLLVQVCICGQPPYQVSLFVRLHPQGGKVHLCNCVILQTRVVVTTAMCVHYQFSPDIPMIPIHPSMISIVAGSTNAFDDALIFNVSSVEILNNFNPITMENDLAVLRLSTSLPLGERKDMQWIVIDDDEYKDNSCHASFSMRNSLDSAPDLAQTEELQVLKTKECVTSSKYSIARKDDICSYYTLPRGFECHALDSFLPFNGDRGTGLVCNSRLVAVMSSILIHRTTNTNCSELLVKAFYTKLGPHLDWIYSIIAVEEYLDVMKPDYTASVPYQREVANMESIITDTTKSVLEVKLSTPTLLPLQYNASENINSLANCSKLRNLHLTYVIFLIRYLIKVFNV